MVSGFYLFVCSFWLLESNTPYQLCTNGHSVSVGRAHRLNDYIAIKKMTNVRDFIWQRMFSASPISDHHCWWSVLVATEGMIPCYLCLSACCECLHSTHLTITFTCLLPEPSHSFLTRSARNLVAPSTCRPCRSRYKSPFPEFR